MRALATSLLAASLLLTTPALAAQPAAPPAVAVPAEPAEVDACRATGLAALRERAPEITGLTFDREALVVAKADTKVEDTPVKAVLMGEANVQRAKGDEPHQFVCLVGEKGKVLLTFFTQR